MQNIETYKRINKQLVDQNREMRRSLAEYRETQTQLCNQLMAERRDRVEERMRFVNIAIRHFRATLHELDPDLDILNLVSAQEESGRGHSDSRTGTDAIRGEQTGSTENRRRTIQSREASQQHSIVTRSSLVSVSPTRRKRSKPSNESGEAISPQSVVVMRRRIPFVNACEGPTNENESEQPEDESDNYIELLESSVKQTQPAAEKEVDNIAAADEDQPVEQVEYAEANGAALPHLSDINEDTDEDSRMLTISHRKENSNTSNPNRSRRRKGQGTTMIPLQDLTNIAISLTTPSSDEESTLERTHSPHIVYRRGKEKFEILEDIVLPGIVITAAPSGQVPAQAAASASMACMQQNPALLREAGLAAADATSFIADDLSSGNIAYAPSSTPRQLKKTTVAEQTVAEKSPPQHTRRTHSQDSLRASARSKRTKTMTTTVTSTTVDDSTLEIDSNTINSRPRRICAPTNMTEGKLNKKLRNENSGERRKRRRK